MRMGGGESDIACRVDCVPMARGPAISPSLRTRVVYTPVHLGRRKGYEEVAASLLEAGADVDARNGEMSTALHWAARKENITLLRMLLDAGATAALTNKYGATPLEQAKAFDKRAAADVLTNAAAIAAQVAAQSGGGASKALPKDGRKKAWGEGAVKGDWRASPSGADAKTPVAIREQAAARRAAADERRQEALKAKERAEESRAKDQAVRRKRERPLHPFTPLPGQQIPGIPIFNCHAQMGAFSAMIVRAGQVAEIKLRELVDAAHGPAIPPAPGNQRSRSRSPPKVGVLNALRDQIKVAEELGVGSSVVQTAAEKLRQGEELRASRLKAAEVAGQIGRGRSPRRKAGDKDPNAEMAKMERKLAKKLNKR